MKNYGSLKSNGLIYPPAGGFNMMGLVLRTLFLCPNV
jgi:hypothetical protein